MKILNRRREVGKGEQHNRNENQVKRETCLAALKTCFMGKEISWGRAGYGQNQLY